LIATRFKSLNIYLYNGLWLRLILLFVRYICSVQVKRDIRTKQSKGFGFIRFAEFESQLKALSQQHLLEGRWCDIRIPNSQVPPLASHV